MNEYMNILLYLFNKKEYSRRAKISSTNKRLYAEHGQCRKVRINNMNGTTDYFYLPVRHRGVKWVGGAI